MNIEDITQDGLYEKVIERILESISPRYMHEDDISAACEEAWQMLVSAILIKLVMEDKVNLNWDSEKKTFLFSNRD